jgi:myo-inositol-1(or 4)-monophosphatase
MNLESICRSVIEIARKAGQFQMAEINKVRSGDVEVKGLHNFVTYVDKTSEEQIVTSLKNLLPEAGFVAEEGTDTNKGNRYNWIVDPLDGTTNYIHRIPLYSVSIALTDGDETILGVVYEPNLNECFYTWQGAPSYLNDKIIKVSDESSMSNALLATGFPYYDYGRMKGYMDLFMYFAENTSGLRRLGSAAVDLAWTACGRCEGFYEYGLHPWDVAAGALLVENAGGQVTDFKGGKDYIFGGEMLATNKILHNAMLTSVRLHFPEKK